MTQPPGPRQSRSVTDADPLDLCITGAHDDANQHTVHVTEDHHLGATVQLTNDSTAGLSKATPRCSSSGSPCAPRAHETITGFEADADIALSTIGSTGEPGSLVMDLPALGGYEQLLRVPAPGVRCRNRRARLPDAGPPRRSVPERVGARDMAVLTRPTGLRSGVPTVSRRRAQRPSEGPASGSRGRSPVAVLCAVIEIC